MKKINFLTQAAMIAALYVVLTLAINAFGLASGAIQVRVSEALTILPYFTPAAIPDVRCLTSSSAVLPLCSVRSVPICCAGTNGLLPFPRSSQIRSLFHSYFLTYMVRPEPFLI